LAGRRRRPTEGEFGVARLQGQGGVTGRLGSGVLDCDRDGTGRSDAGLRGNVQHFEAGVLLDLDGDFELPVLVECQLRALVPALFDDPRVLVLSLDRDGVGARVGVLVDGHRVRECRLSFGQPTDDARLGVEVHGHVGVLDRNGESAGSRHAVVEFLVRVRAVTQVAAVGDCQFHVRLLAGYHRVLFERDREVRATDDVGDHDTGNDAQQRQYDQQVCAFHGSDGPGAGRPGRDSIAPSSFSRQVYLLFLSY
jgi:hypothetical protein